MTKTDEQIIWKNLSIGAPDAEADKDLLNDCFVDNGCLDLIRSTEKHSSIILGRTGAGKSAILLRLQSLESNVTALNPLELAFRFIENSTVIQFFEKAGVNLNLFYRLLWRHILITELIKRKYNFRDQGSLSKWFDSLINRIDKNSARARSLAYLRRWGERFWEETEVRLSEITKKIEAELSASLEGSLLGAKLKGGRSGTLTDEERAEVVSRGSSVINKIQIADLNRVMQIFSDEVFNDPKNRFYITIDTLDEEWVSQSSRYRLIRALIEEVRTFRKEMQNVKIVIALRRDLLDKVFEETRDGGFQEEKYETYYANILWSRDELLNMLTLRVNEVFKRKYTGGSIDLNDVFPKSRGDKSPYEYMLERTIFRPRDVIAYANECFAVAANRPRVSWQAISDAELQYSRKRRNALIDEWLNTYPSVGIALDVIRGMPESFSRSAITDEMIDGAAVQASALHSEDELVRLSQKLYDPSASTTRAQVLNCILQVLYKIGAIGIKFSTESPYIWSFRDQSSISYGEAKRAMSIHVHKMLWRGLEIRTGQLV